MLTATGVNPTEKMWARLKRKFTNKLFYSLEQISLFIGDAVNELDKKSIVSTCVYKYIFLTPFGMKYKSNWH